MFNFDNVQEEIKNNEGFRSKIYECSQGFSTIGYGRNLETNGITEFEAGVLLRGDLFSIDTALYKSFDWYKGLPDNVREVLIEMAFQLGVTGLKKFVNTLNFISSGDYLSASKEMLNSEWAKQTPRRAKKLSEKISKIPF